MLLQRLLRVGREIARPPASRAAAAATSSALSARRASPVGVAGDELARVRPSRDGRRRGPSGAAERRDRAGRADLLLGERAQGHHPAAREERGVHLEGGVLGGGADERHRALLHVRQERVLLRLVEAVDLVDEQDGALAVHAAPVLGRAATISRMSFTPASTALNGTKTAPVRLAMMRASVVLPVPGGPQRMSEGTWSRLDGPAQGAARAEHVLLPDEVLQRARAHAARRAACPPSSFSAA